MTKFSLFVFCVTLLFSCKTTIETFNTADSNKVGVKSNKFRGTIFKSFYPKEKLYIQVDDSLHRFTPTTEDIKLAEKILKIEIQIANKSHINQFEKRQYIDKNLNKYFRQYIGFINEQGDSVVHINFHWDRFTIFDRTKGYWDDRLEYSSDFSRTLDGGSRYWSINVNLTIKALYGLSVNGVG